MSVCKISKPRKAPTLFLAVGMSLALACSSNNPTPTTGTALSKPKGRLLISSETSSAVQVIDLEQSALENESKSYLSNSQLVASPEGQFAFVVQASGNRVDLLKMGPSVAIASTQTATAAVDSHDGHNHKPLATAEPIYRAATTTSSETSSTTATSSVTPLNMSITGQGLGMVVSKGQWVSIPFQNEVIVLSEEKLESHSTSLTELPFHKINSTLPGIPLDAEHLALGGNVVEISDGALLHSSGNASARLLVSANIISATRSTEGIGLYGTDQGVLQVAKHATAGVVGWEDFIVPYPTITESQIFLAEGHDHGAEEEAEVGLDEHEEVITNRTANAWATHDGLTHDYVHLTHEQHSAGVYLFKATTLEPELYAGAWTYLEGTSSANVRPVAMEIAHGSEYLLLILMSDGSLRIHDASHEGELLHVISGLISPMTDFHPGEGNYPSLTSGLGKAYVGDAKTNQVHQIDLKTYRSELTWITTTKPNRLLLLGESKLSGNVSSTHTH